MLYRSGFVQISRANLCGFHKEQIFSPIQARNVGQEEAVSDVTLKAICAGVLFGLWPIVMNRSGLSGTVSAAVLEGVALLFVLPFAFRTGSLEGASWGFAIAAGCLAGIGLLAFNDAIARTTPKTVGTMFVLMIVVQTMVPAVYHTVMNGQLTPKTAIGFAAAILAGILLA